MAWAGIFSAAHDKRRSSSLRSFILVQPVAVVFVHGIHTLEPGYHARMQAALEAQLPANVRSSVTFRSVFWAGRVRERQKQYLDAVATAALFDVNAYRRLVVQGLGDAAAYQKTRSYRNSAYYQIQSDVRTVLDELDSENLPERPLIFVGHSLGCHIISSFVWDINTVKQWGAARAADEDEEVLRFAEYLKGGSPFRRLDTLAGLVMMGSNMPLFTFTFGPDRIMPITTSRSPEEAPAFPGSALPEATLDRARWLNFYSRNDLLGYPLKPLNAAYAREARLSDIEVAAEGWWRRTISRLVPALSPAVAYRAHTGYWVNDRVVRRTADFITAIATAGETPAPRNKFAFWRRGKSSQR